MALVVRRVASLDGDSAFVELTVDDADLDTRWVNRGALDDPPDPLAAARVMEIRVFSSLTRGIWVRVIDETRPATAVVSVRDRGKIEGDLRFDSSTGRRTSLGDLSWAIGAE